MKENITLIFKAGLVEETFEKFLFYFLKIENQHPPVLGQNHS